MGKSKEELEEIIKQGLDLSYADRVDSNGNKYLNMSEEEKKQYRLSCTSEERIVGRIVTPSGETFGIKYVDGFKKGQQMEMVSYPHPEDVVLSKEQINEFARHIYNNLDDVHKYIEDNKEEYEKWLKENKED